MPSGKAKSPRSGRRDPKVVIYPAWCKKCGNCVAFCPVQALEEDEWGFPRLARPEECTSCRLCEKLCPDFAITVGEAPVIKGRSAEEPAPRATGDRSTVDRRHSPERVPPVLEHHRDEEESDREET
ncbi:MAG: ferredoxin family protein [Desulfomonilaceae bacterium]|nr:ferredoxin family protein [Desulfomonilaceae bacterium]